jgi:hypothetical protein
MLPAMQLKHAIREGPRGFRHGYESAKEVRLANEPAAVPFPRSLWTWFEDSVRVVLSAIAVIVGCAIVAAVLLILVAVVKWAYLEVFYK